MAFILNEVYSVLKESSEQYEADLKIAKQQPQRGVFYEDELFHVHRYVIPEKYFPYLKLFDQCVLNSMRYLEQIKLTDDYNERKLFKHNYNILRRTENKILRGLLIYMLENEDEIDCEEWTRLSPDECHDFWVQETKK